MKRLYLIGIVSIVSLHILGMTPEQECIENYYKELNYYSSHPDDIQSMNRLQSMFYNGGLIYNDVKDRLEEPVTAQVHINGFMAYIGKLWNTKDVKLHFSPSNFEVLTTKKPDIVQNVEQKVSFVSIDKHVTGTGDIDYYSHEMFQIENGKIVRIDRYNNSKKQFLSALRYYEIKLYSKAFDAFRYEAENNQNEQSAYWLAIMLLKKQGCSNIDKRARDAMALFWLSKLGNKEGANRILKILQVGKEPDTTCDKPMNDGLISDINSRGKYGYINQYGHTMIGYRYEYARAFRHGFAVVSYGYKRYGVINTKGVLIVPCEYDDIEDMNGSGYMYAKKGNNNYRIDNNGNVTKL